MAKRKINTASLNKTSHNHLSSGPSVDTHKFVKSFTVTGMKEAQAEAIVSAIVESRDHNLSNLATKDQLEAIKVQLDAIKEELKFMTTKEQIESFKISIKEEMKYMATKEDQANLEARLLRWFIATAIATIGILSGIIVAAVKFIH